HSPPPPVRFAAVEKNALKPWLKQQWVLPPKANAAFVAALEDVPEVYTRPYDEKRPVGCLDEGGKQRIGDGRPPLPVRPGQPRRPGGGARRRRPDGDYPRHGTANLFMAFEPLRGRRHVEVTERRTNKDFARLVKGLLDVRYPAAERVVLVLDNLSTHTPAALY